MRKVYIYVGTGYKSPSQKEGAYGYLLEYPTPKGPVTGKEFGYLKDTTCHRAELKALVEALKHLKETCDLEIFTDSAYIAATWEKGLPEKWQGQGWKNSRGKDIANREEWQEMLKIPKRDVVFHLKEEHPYRQWLTREIKKKGEEDV